MSSVPVPVPRITYAVRASSKEWPVFLSQNPDCRVYKLDSCECPDPAMQRAVGKDGEAVIACVHCSGICPLCGQRITFGCDPYWVVTAGILYCYHCKKGDWTKDTGRNARIASGSDNFCIENCELCHALAINPYMYTFYIGTDDGHWRGCKNEKKILSLESSDCEESSDSS